ncbi:MAG TPA: PPK2 family polyphosphate kinase [Chloroflexota bacterium]|nr:PPK2 family polyphosphate kinase [Chloroflexota bacterium]
MALAFRVEPGKKVRLADLDPASTGGLKRADAAKDTAKQHDQLTDLQEMLYAAGDASVLIVLQGLDTAGKDGTITHVMGAFNPMGCRVESFKVPTPTEAAHDFLWRVHMAAPARGMIAIFNRSHYEDVLVTRVHKLAPKKVWERRFDRINQFEALLTENGSIVLKFFLYISKDEQRARLEAREADRDKAWKLSSSDWPEHELYDQYVEVYEEALSRCSTEHAPWYIVPANHKWFRNLVVARTIAEALEGRRKQWREAVEARGAVQLAARKAAKKS